MRAVLRETGVKLGKPGRSRFAARVRELAGDDPLVMSIVAPLLEMLDAMLEQTARLTKKILDIVRQEPICRRLMPAGVFRSGGVSASFRSASTQRPQAWQ